MHGARCLALVVASAVPLLAQDGPSVYRAACASCHDTGIDRAPTRAALMAMTPERVLAALESGSMISMTAARSASERRAVAEFVTGKSLQRPLVTRPSPGSMCGPRTVFADPSAGPGWNGWGVNLTNQRSQPPSMAGLKMSL